MLALDHRWNWVPIQTPACRYLARHTHVLVHRYLYYRYCYAALLAHANTRYHYLDWYHCAARYMPSQLLSQDAGMLGCSQPRSANIFTTMLITPSHGAQSSAPDSRSLKPTRHSEVSRLLNHIHYSVLHLLLDVPLLTTVCQHLARQ